MRQQSKSNRPRNKNGRKPNGPSANRVYESSGPEGKVRGTPQQIIEKYQSLARDKSTSGDRVMAEAFLQHAEHYMRILTAAQTAQQGRADERSSHEDRGDDDQSAERGGGRGDDRSGSEADGDEDRVSESLAVIGDEGDDDAGIVETPENGGGRRRSRRPTRRPRGENEGEGETAASEDGSRPARARRRSRSARSDAEGDAAAPELALDGPEGSGSDDGAVRAAE